MVRTLWRLFHWIGYLTFVFPKFCYSKKKPYLIYKDLVSVLDLRTCSYFFLGRWQAKKISVSAEIFKLVFNEKSELSPFIYPYSKISNYTPF